MVASSSETSPARARPRTWAVEPGQVVGRQPPVVGQADGERQQLLGRLLGAEAALPERHGWRPPDPAGRRRHRSAGPLAGRPGLDAEAPEAHEALGVRWRKRSAAS